jgi:hypothetical protein
MAETKTINLDIETNLGSLKSQLREAQAEVAAMADKFGVTSQQAAEAAKKAAELKDRIADAKDLTDAFNPDAKFNALSRSIGGALDGFQAFEGAIGLVGVESEELQKTLLKVQSAMALSQGIQGVMEAKDSFVQLGAVVKNAFAGMTTAAKVFMVSGIGILIAALGVLVAKWDDVKSALTPATAQAKKFEQTTRESGEAARAALDSFDEYEKTLKRLGFTEDQIADKRRKRFKEAIDQTKRELKAAQDLYNSQKENLKTVEIFDSLGLNATGRALFGDEEEAKAQRKRVAQLRQDIAKIKNDEYEFNQQQKQAREDAKKQAEDEAKQRAIDAANKRKEVKDKQAEELATLAQYNREATDLFKSEYEKQVRDIKEKYAEQIKLAKKYKQDTTALEAAQTKELEDALDKSMQPMETLSLAKFQVQQRDLGTLQGSVNQELKLKQDQAATELQILEAKATRAEQIEAKSQSFKVNAIKSGLDTIASISELFGKKSEKAAKRAFQVQKAANIASALISTYQSATSAYASQFTPVPTPDSPIRGGIAAGLAVAAGLANVAKIGQQKFESPSPSGSNPPNTSGLGGGQIQAPSFNVVGNSGVNQLAQLQQTPMQAYVVSGNVTTAQSLDRNRIENATL